MKILLNGEEIERLSEEWLNADEEVDWAASVAKAQLKKVVERLKRGSMATHQVTLHLSEKDWQALLEEVE